ncbi:hypothetical protein EDD37DRAFT_403190 [Exophiala viscosa]|uniref:MYND-type domain-containing protein n=1 Tax=Exophiala viscosa TaxID=2486360 RepID=A0AAN6IFB7_9EURO|nr:hypothetical protein EDD36DRAFT_168484 [Exophiala viscosa]KAI1624200.1 hypothetical protein EDD37DRAFT_403190 [Exophiala viscosa]
MCPRRGTKVCAKCKDARYCSTDCQKVDWKQHKILCPTFNQETKPDAFHRRGLFYPGGEQKARYVWMEVWTEHEGDAFWDCSDFGPYLGGGFGGHGLFSDPNPIQAREVTRDDTEAGLEFWHMDLNVMEPPNLGLRACTRGQACAPNFRGPILVTRKVELGDCMEKSVDVDSRDARTAADHFSWWYRDGSGKMPHLKDQRILVTSCVSPQHVADFNLSSKYLEHVIDGCDSIFASGGSGIANLLGIPLSLRLIQPFGEPSESRRTKAAMLLMRDVTSMTFGPHPRSRRYIDRNFCGTNGFASSGSIWSGDTVGSVVAARFDGLPLLRQHVVKLSVITLRLALSQNLLQQSRVFLPATWFQNASVS